MGFHWERLNRPPITPVRVPVIGKEQLPVKKEGVSRFKSELGRNDFELRNKSKENRNRRKERRKNSCTNEKVKIVGVNAAGIMSKIESFENFLNTQVPTIFCVQETKLKRPNQIRTKSSKNYNFYELHRKSSSDGGLCIGVHI